MRLFQNLKKKAKGFTLVELMIVVAIIGILAAIAIPAFVRYIKSSKAAESEGIMRKFADGAKGYFTSEQRYSNSTSGDQPWHSAGAVTGNTAPGLPVPGSAYVFPGGSSCQILTSAAVPVGGAKTVPLLAGTCSAVNRAAALNKMNVTIEDALYFQYTYLASGVSTGAAVTLTAKADFDGQGGDMHTGTMFVNAQVGGDVRITPMSLINEFE